MAEFTEVIDYFQAHPGGLEAGCSQVTRKETHISVVLLTASFAFKFKKPVSLGFIEQTSLAARLENCQQEKLLNARLAPDVYLGTRGVHSAAGGYRISDELENALEYCVQMRRLDESYNLLGLLRQNALNLTDCDRIALRLSRFHAALRRGGSAAGHYQFEKNLSDNIEALRQSATGCPADRLTEITELYAVAKSILGRRQQQGRIIDGHGDLRLEHVFLQNGQCTIIDCVEFNAGIRAVDPLEDIAFVSLGFRMENRNDFADAFLNAYFSYSLDPDPRLMPLFEIYRATVRMKVDLIQLAGTNDSARMQYLTNRLQKYDRLVAALLRKAKTRSAAAGHVTKLILVMGPPLSGKSTRARELSHKENAVILATDVARKKILKTDIFADLSAEFQTKTYSARMKSRVYRYLYALAQRYLNQGVPVILDGTFNQKAERSRFAALAHRFGAELRFEMLDIDEATAASRIEERKRTASTSDLKDIETWKKVRAQFE